VILRYPASKERSFYETTESPNDTQDYVCYDSLRTIGKFDSSTTIGSNRLDDAIDTGPMSV
jgi:hypothetical protein